VSVVQEEVCYRLDISSQVLFKSAQCVQVILAALNEEQGIAYTIQELREHLDNPLFLVVDGNSTDNTAKIARNLGTEVICQKGTGKGDALNSAIEHIDPNATYIVLNDADYTYPAEYLPLMIKILDENPQIGMVCGNRFNSNYPLQGMKEVFRIGNKLIAVVHNMFTGVALSDPLTGLRVIRAELMRDWTPKSEKFDIEVELNVYIQSRGFEITEVPISYRSRIGEKKLKVKDGASIFRRILLESFRYPVQ